MAATDAPDVASLEELLRAERCELFGEMSRCERFGELFGEAIALFIDNADDDEQLPDEGGEEPVMPRRERPAAGSVVVRTAPAAAPAPAPKPPATPEPKQEEEDEATLIARLEASGELPPKYVRGRPVLLLLKIEVGPGKRAALVVRQGDDPGWLAKSFCRRHNVPAQRVGEVQACIEQNL